MRTTQASCRIIASGGSSTPRNYISRSHVVVFVACTYRAIDPARILLDVRSHIKHLAGVLRTTSRATSTHQRNLILLFTFLATLGWLGLHLKPIHAGCKCLLSIMVEQVPLPAL